MTPSISGGSRGNRGMCLSSAPKLSKIVFLTYKSSIKSDPHQKCPPKVKVPPKVNFWIRPCTPRTGVFGRKSQQMCKYAVNYNII